MQHVNRSNFYFKIVETKAQRLIGKKNLYVNKEEFFKFDFYCTSLKNMAASTGTCDGKCFGVKIQHGLTNKVCDLVVYTNHVLELNVSRKRPCG